jgi:hypothetical protein
MPCCFLLGSSDLMAHNAMLDVIARRARPGDEDEGVLSFIPHANNAANTTCMYLFLALHCMMYSTGKHAVVSLLAIASYRRSICMHDGASE